MDYSIVLVGRFPGKDRAVATALSRDFGREEAWGMQIIGAAPIILLESLTADQANNIIIALADVEDAGSRLEIKQGIDPNLPKLSWPAPPRIKGKTVPEYAVAGAGAAAIGATGGTVSLLVPCPYTGQKMRLTLTISLSRVGDQVTAGVAASAAPVAVPVAASPVAIPVPAAAIPRTTQSSSANTAYRPIPTPVITPVRAVPKPAAQPPARSTPNVGSQQAVVHGLDDLDELEPMPQFQPQAAPAAVAPRPPVPVAARPAAPGPVAARPRTTSGPVPLPDVPVLNNAAPPTAIPLPNSDPMPVDLLSAPMDLSAFESKVSASGIMRAVTAQDAPAAAGDNNGGGADDGSICAVSIGKSNNPKVHQLVSEILGVSLNEATKLCQKPILTIAKDISMPDAQSIKQQLAAVGCAAKIASRRP